MENPQQGNVREVDAFILNRIDSVPHLEALLLLWRNKDSPWSPAEVAKRLWIPPDRAEAVLNDLAREQLIIRIDEARKDGTRTDGADARFVLQSEPEKDRLLQAVESTYAREMIRLTTMIHSKPSSAIREFARAFRFKKEGE